MYGHNRDLFWSLEFGGLEPVRPVDGEQAYGVLH